MKELTEALKRLLSVTIIWISCISNPIVTLNALLPEVTDKNPSSLVKVVQIWIPALLISLICSFPILKLYGIEWNNVGYHLCNWMIVIGSLIVTSIVIHCFFILFKRSIGAGQPGFRQCGKRKLLDCFP